MSEPTTRLQMTVDMELERFDDKHQDWLRYAIAGFLDISPHSVRIVAIEESGVRIVIELPTRNASMLLSAYQRNDPELVKCLVPLVLLDLGLEMTRREGIPDPRLSSVKQPVERVQVTKLDVLEALYTAYEAAPGEKVNSERLRKILGLDRQQMNEIILTLRERGFIEANFLGNKALLRITPDGVAVLHD